MSVIAQSAPARSVFPLFVRRALANPSLCAGTLIVGMIVLAALFAQWIAPYDPLLANPLERYIPPLSAGHILGTDEIGRDILSRLIHGSRLALMVAVVPTAVAMLIGGAIGLVSGYAGGFWDAAIMRVFDVMFAFPGILLALGISAALGPGTGSMVIAMMVVTIPAFGRITRGMVLGVKQELYVEAGRTLGYSRTRILLGHILPNVLGPIIVYATLQTGRNVILAASLSFLGLGAQPPAPDWGQMLSSGRTALTTAAFVATLPGLAIMLLAIGFNLIGDGARDLLDPSRQRDLK